MKTPKIKSKRFAGLSKVDIDIDWSRDIARIQEIVRSPKTFFAGISTEKGYNTSFSFFLFITAISSVLSFVVYALANRAQAGDPTTIPAFALSFLVNLPLSFLFALLLHGWIRIFRGKGQYQKTYRLYVYSRTPTVLTSFLPLVSLIGWIYSLYVLGVALHTMYGFSTKKIVIMLAIPLALLFLSSYLAYVSLSGM